MVFYMTLCRIDANRSSESLTICATGPLTMRKCGVITLDRVIDYGMFNDFGVPSPRSDPQ